MDFDVPIDHREKLKEIKKRYKYLDLARELKKTTTMEHISDTNCNWCAWYSHQRIGTKIGDLGNNRTNGDHPNYRNSEIRQNTEKSPGYLRRLAVT